MMSLSTVVLNWSDVQAILNWGAGVSGEVPFKPARVIKQRHIHTTTGFSYVSIFVTDVDAVLERAKAAGHKPYAQSPQRLPEGLPQDVCLLMLKDPDGNFVEIIGPLTKKLQKAK